MHVKEGIVGNAFATGIGNNIVSLLSGIMIFGTVFAVLKTGMGMAGPEVLEVMRNSGPAATGLTFIWMPQLFEKMPLGSTLAVLFFLGLTFAGFTSLVAMLELPIRVLLDSGMKRGKAIAVAVAVIYLLGIPSATNLNILSNQDYVWGIALIISGGFIAFAIIKSSVGAVYLEVNGVPSDSNIAKWWILEMKYLVPTAAIVLLVWWLFQSITVFAPDDWYNPLNAFSVMTCVGQWTLILGLSIVLNRLIVRKLQI
jgi:NSS family neurotransmitter:Na+ symporter